MRLGPGILAGDLNMIYRAQDKNNSNLNRRRMGQFRCFLNDATLKEIHLDRRLFTWSNEWLHPTLERIDRVFTSTDWEFMFPNADLQSLSSLCSDHAPLLLRTDNFFEFKRRFYFRSMWTRFPGFMDAVRRAWCCPLRQADPFKRLDWLFRNTARALQSWSTKHVGSVRLQLELAKEVVHRLEMARDRRQLAEHEELLRRQLKMKSLRLSSLQRSIARQESRLLWLTEGDAPTKFFHAQANSHRRSKFIKALEHQGTLYHDEGAKANLVHKYFVSIMGTTPIRTHYIDLQRIGVPVTNLTGLDDRFTEAEIWNVIKELHPNKSPGPNGFTARFL